VCIAHADEDVDGTPRCIGVTPHACIDASRVPTTHRSAALAFVRASTNLSALAPGWRNGRRDGFKIHFPQGSRGSSPRLGTTHRRIVERTEQAHTDRAPSVARSHAMDTRTKAESIVDPLTSALLPVLLHRLNNATQILHGWNALLAVSRSADERAGADLAFASQVVDETGWVLAVLASASGADLLLARRERRGLAPLLEVVRDALRRSDRELATCDSPPPSLAPTWEWRWSRAVDRDELACRAPDSGHRDDLERRTAERLAAARFRRASHEHVLVLPPGSLQWEVPR
jgi:hypothetical protein